MSGCGGGQAEMPTSAQGEEERIAKAGGLNAKWRQPPPHDCGRARHAFPLSLTDVLNSINYS